MAAILLFALLLSLTGCGHDEYAESDMLPAYLVSVTAGEANGSGILYQKDQHWLYVLTAAHVVSGMEPGGQAALRFRDGWEISANNISASATTDIALIRIPLDKIPDEREESYQCVESDKDSFDRLLIGDACTAVGLARDGGELRYEGTILDPWIYMDDYGQYMLWAEGKVQPGMSGGGLLDAEGRLAGILSGGSEDGELAAVPLSLILQFMLECTQ
ncbi:MAG: trypsin-like peptidase domain-containing protein [Lachnospiraceae bacterium]|nr:serine protease [uncultured Acetatifactor sp.]MCI8542779.1 trypsin-like peptidase domain-containing protein [Lachnospiraceae bacterium]